MAERTASDLPEVPVAIIAGGTSRRFGADKATARLKGRRFIDIVLDRIDSQTNGPIAVNASQEIDLHDRELPLVRDRAEGRLGPLAGIHAAMVWAEQAGYAAVVTLPVDTPIIPGDFVARLHGQGPAAFAHHGGRDHFVHAIWPAREHANLLAFLESEGRRVHEWAAQCQAVRCNFPAQDGSGVFLNINKPEDLAALERI